MIPERFRGREWGEVKYDETGKTKWNWMCTCVEGLEMGEYVDIGAFSYINACEGVEIGDNVQIGSHCSIYSCNSIDGTSGRVVVKDRAKVGSHSVILPGITVGEGAIVGAFSFVNRDVGAGEVVFGIPIKTRRFNAVQE